MTNITWTFVKNPLQWDQLASSVNAHPLQSALWGEARKEIDNIASLYLAGLHEKQIKCLARVETRTLPAVGNVAWIPKGPFIAESHPLLLQQLQCELKDYNFHLIITDEYKIVTSSQSTNLQTIFIDLTQDEDILLKNLHKQWRYGVRRAKKEGVKFEVHQTEQRLGEFYQLCNIVSQSKSFELPGSLELMDYLLKNNFHPNLRFILATAEYQNKIIAGAIVAQSGNHLHYFWGASDRAYSTLRGGEAVQWGIIQWAIQNKLLRYDLEGIDPVTNPGTYAFKKKMGGEIVNLSGKRYYPLTLKGNIAKTLGVLFKKI